MKVPAIRGKIGNWTYYVCNFSFQQVANHVKRIDGELHSSASLKDQIQRSLTDNFQSIKHYILNQEDRFFNALVLAIYDGSPKWVEVEIDFNGESFYNMGFLELNGEEKIFPVDGQHRVEGIKSALDDDQNLTDESIPVILVSHRRDEEGMKRSRRLFTTLNRYARPVGQNDIIALDEDDSAAIVTRYLLEEYELFSKKRVDNAEGKNIPDNNKDALTSLITLYQCNLEILKSFIKKKHNHNPTALYLSTYLKYRKPQSELNQYHEYVIGFWDSLKSQLGALYDFLEIEDRPAEKFRNNETGGNLLFRPVGILPFVQVVLEINSKSDISFEEIAFTFNDINLQIAKNPWANVLWNPIERTMIMGSSGLVKLLLKYLYSESLLTNNELKRLKKKYAAKINYDVEADPELNKVLDHIK